MKKSQEIGLVATIMSFFFVWIEMLLWNSCLVPMFSIKTITYWRMFGIDLFIALLTMNSVRGMAYSKIVDSEKI